MVFVTCFFSFPSRNLHISGFLPLPLLHFNGAVSPHMLELLNLPRKLCIVFISYFGFSLIPGSHTPSASGPFSALTPSMWPQEILAKYTQVQQLHPGTSGCAPKLSCPRGPLLQSPSGWQFHPIHTVRGHHQRWHLSSTSSENLSLGWSIMALCAQYY